MMEFPLDSIEPFRARGAFVSQVGRSTPVTTLGLIVFAALP